MRKRLFILALFLFPLTRIWSQSIPYISPGVTLSYNFNGSLVFSPKISVGLVENGNFINLTLGKSWSTDPKTYPHSFVEFQYGTLSFNLKFRNQKLFLGGGVGFSLPSKEDKPASFRLTLFGGFFYFLNMSFLFMEQTQYELGGQVVLPIPIIRIGNLNG